VAHRQLSEAGIPVAIVNPRKVKAFATGMGNAKTDTLDAKLLAQYAERVRPARVLVPDLTSQQLSELVSRRQLVEMQVAEKNRLSRASETVKADLTEPIEVTAAS
jgi:transposase